MRRPLYGGAWPLRSGAGVNGCADTAADPLRCSSCRGPVDLLRGARGRSSMVEP
ncbi:hypothetical protein DTW94_09900 [Streptomyces cavourensis]|uniref:Uncharacterized protein n=1 Tax=Streptomyces cavourensis TaxID=67258 RepID=A0AAD0VE73_9ACTN|nr:hypothetical protein DTW94_09900 [Streptomyces cavourensis]